MEEVLSKDSYRMAKFFMTTSSSWPKKNPSRTYVLRCYLNWILDIAFLATHLMELVIVMGNLAKLNEILAILTSTVTMTCKLTSYTINKNIFLDMLDRIDEDVFNVHSSKYKTPLIEGVKFINRISICYALILLGCCLGYAAIPFIDPTKMPISFSYDLGKYKLYMSAFQVLCVLAHAWNIVGGDLCCASFLMLAGAQIDIFKLKVQDVVDEARKKVSQQRKREENAVTDEEIDDEVNVLLRQCVIHHYAIVSFVEQLEEVFASIAFFQYVANVVNVCSRLVQFYVTSNIGYSQVIATCFSLIGVMLQLLLYHWFGNEVILKSSTIGESCYFSKWYECSSKTKRSIFIMMERTKRPLYITVYKFTEVSLDSFVTLVRWSYSIFALMQNMYSDR